MRMRMIIGGAAALVLSACAKAPVQESFRPLVLTASVEGDAVPKTTLGADFKTVRWSADDAIAVFSGGNKYTSSSTEIQGGPDSQTAKFTFGTLDAGASVSYAVYPASAAVEKYNEGATVVVPTVQTAVADGFDPAAAVTIAKAGSGSMTFLNVCAYLAFTIKSEDAASVSSVRIYANEPMTGTADVAWNSGNPTVTFSRSVSAHTGVLLNGPFESGKTYYVAIYPNTYTGLTFKLTHFTTGYVSTYTSATSLEVARKANKVIAKDMALRTPTSGQWFEKEPAFIGNDDPVIIVGKCGGSYKLIKNTDTYYSGVYYAPDAAAATVSGSQVTSAVTADYQWKRHKASDGVYTLFPVNTTERRLYCSTTSESGSQNCMNVGVVPSGDVYRSLFSWDAAGHIFTAKGDKKRYLSCVGNAWYGETYPNSTSYPAAVFSFYVHVP